METTLLVRRFAVSSKARLTIGVSTGPWTRRSLARIISSIEGNLSPIASSQMTVRGVPRTGFWNGASTLKQCFVFPKNGSKYYLKYTFLAFPVLGILVLGTPLMTVNSNRSEERDGVTTEISKADRCYFSHVLVD